MSEKVEVVKTNKPGLVWRIAPRPDGKGLVLTPSRVAHPRIAAWFPVPNRIPEMPRGHRGYVRDGRGGQSTYKTWQGWTNKVKKVYGVTPPAGYSI